MFDFMIGCNNMAATRRVEVNLDEGYIVLTLMDFSEKIVRDTYGQLPNAPLEFRGSHSYNLGSGPKVFSTGCIKDIWVPIWLPLSSVIGRIVLREVRWRGKMRAKEVDV